MDWAKLMHWVKLMDSAKASGWASLPAWQLRSGLVMAWPLGWVVASLWDSAAEWPSRLVVLAQRVAGSLSGAPWLSRLGAACASAQ
ncbi:MAG TPA: hypothetical protein VF120_10025 [Ktedonobacterales bacterium]